jgi:glutathionyl-hydroquinone reductase
LKDPEYSGRVTVPVLFDLKVKRKTEYFFDNL